MEEPEREDARQILAAQVESFQQLRGLAHRTLVFVLGVVLLVGLFGAAGVADALRLYGGLPPARSAVVLAGSGLRATGGFPEGFLTLNVTIGGVLVVVALLCLTDSAVYAWRAVLQSQPVPDLGSESGFASGPSEFIFQSESGFSQYQEWIRTNERTLSEMDYHLSQGVRRWRDVVVLLVVAATFIGVAGLGFGRIVRVGTAANALAALDLVFVVLTVALGLVAIAARGLGDRSGAAALLPSEEAVRRNLPSRGILVVAVVLVLVADVALAAFAGLWVAIAWV